LTQHFKVTKECIYSCIPQTKAEGRNQSLVNVHSFYIMGIKVFPLVCSVVVNTRNQLLFIA